MILADVVAVIAALVGLALALPALWLAARALLPGPSTQARLRLERTPWLSILVGAVLQVPLLLPALVLMNVGPGPVRGAGVLWFAAWLGVALVGCGGLAALIGSRLGGPGDTARPWLPTVRGGLVLTLACGLPVLGWFLLLPLALVAGTGAVGLGAVFRLKTHPAEDTEPLEKAA